ncbi:hypothetical protein CL658_05715 [bacterium]|nr:hypothetical protein [bacterium]|tara:strand:+ start:3470 stop:4117 length:648 start_codon:yes stop_codon:yes gene_type:complete
MIFKIKKIIITQTSITIEKTTTIIPFFEFINSKDQQKKILTKISHKSIHIILDTSLKSYHKSIKKICHDNHITIHKISLENKSVIYRKKKDYLYLSIPIISLILLITSWSLNLTKNTLTLLIQRNTQTKHYLSSQLSFQKNVNKPIYETASSIINRLVNKPVFIQKITIKAPNIMSIIIFSYQDISTYIFQHQQTHINPLTNFKKGDYYEITYIL